MRILLTGASGQVGGALEPLLSGHDVHAPTRTEFDLEQSATITPFVERLRPQLIVNCAAYTAVDDAERESARALAVNGVAPGLIAMAARACGAGLIHFSTDYVFDGSGTRPYRETDPCGPLNFYGSSKLQGELAIAESGAAHLIVRTSWIYAPKGKNFLTAMLRLGAERDTIQVVGDQTGAPTSAAALASMVAAILSRMNADPAAYLGAHGGLLHASCAGQTTWHGFATAIFEELRRRRVPLAVETIDRIDSKQFAAPARRPAYSVLDHTRLNREFGVNLRQWRDALTEAIDQLAPRTAVE